MSIINLSGRDRRCFRRKRTKSKRKGKRRWVKQPVKATDCTKTNKSWYENYLDSSHWKERKQQFAKTHPTKCFVCGSRQRIALHHISYERLWNEEDADFCWLCEQHHKEVHGRIKTGKCILRNAHLEVSKSYSKPKVIKIKKKIKRRAWEDELETILTEFSVKPLPSLESESSNKAIVAERVRRKYLVRKVDYLKKSGFPESKVHDLFNQARFKKETSFWIELDRQYHEQGVFSL